MKNESNLYQQLVELVHNLLPEDQAAELRARIDLEPEAGVLYRQIVQKADMIAEAAKLETEKSLFAEDSPLLLSVLGKRKLTDVNFREDKSTGEDGINHPNDTILQTATENGVTQIVHASHLKKRALRVFSWEFAKRAIQQERGINRVMTWSAVCLVVLTFCGFLYQRYQIREVADVPLRVCATVPDILVEGAGQTIHLQVSDLLGNTKQTPVRMSLMSGAGDLLAEQTIPTDENGRLSFPIASLLDSTHFDSFRQQNVRLQEDQQPGRRRSGRTFDETAKSETLKKPVDNQIADQIVLLEISVDKPSAEKQVAKLRLVTPEAETAFDYHAMVANANRSMASRQPVMVAMMQPMTQSSSLRASASSGSGSGFGMDRSKVTRTETGGSGMMSSSGMGAGMGMGGMMSVPAQTPYQPQMSTPDVKRDGMLFGNLYNHAPQSSSSQYGKFKSLDARDSEGNPIVRIGNSSDKTGGAEKAADSYRPSSVAVSPVPASLPVELEIAPLPASDMTNEPIDKKSGSAESLELRTTGSFAMPEQVAAKKTDSITVQAAPLEVTLFPEGGRLAAVLENRVFFKGMNSDPSDGDSRESLSGKLVDDMNNTIVSVRPTFDGYGEFRFVPQPYRKYRLVVERKEPGERGNPAVTSYEFDLGEADVDVPVAMSLAKHVIETGNTETGHDDSEPVTVHLRSNMERRPFVVSVSKDGVPICAEPVTTDSGMTTVTLPLDKSVLGMLDVSVFDARNESLPLLANEKILRRPKHWATVKASCQKLPHEQAAYRVDLQIVDSQGISIPGADVSVHVVQVDSLFDAGESSKESLIRRLPTATMQKLFGASSAATESETIDWATLESLISSGDSESQVKLDLLLATYRPKMLAVPSPTGSVGGNMSGSNVSAVNPPLVFDNYGELKHLYQHKIDVFQSKQQTWQRIVGIVGIFGGMSLALLSMMLVIMRLASGMRMTMIVVASGLSCILICMMMLQGQSVSKPVPMKDVSFAVPNAHNGLQNNARPLEMDSSGTSNPSETVSSRVTASDIGMYSVSNSVAEQKVKEPEWNRPNPSQQEANPYLTMVYENEHLKIDAQGNVSIDFSSPQNREGVFYVIVDAVTPTGVPAVLRLPLK